MGPKYLNIVITAAMAITSWDNTKQIFLVCEYKKKMLFFPMIFVSYPWMMSLKIVVKF